MLHCKFITNSAAILWNIMKCGEIWGQH